MKRRNQTCELPSKHDPIREAVHIIDHSKEFMFLAVTFRA